MVMSLLSLPSERDCSRKLASNPVAGLRPATPLAKAEEAGVTAATTLGLSGADATVEQLRAIPAEKFAANREVARGVGGPIDGRFKTQATVDAFANNTANYVPLLIGSNNGEGGFDGARKVAGLMSSHAPSFLYQFGYVPNGARLAQPNGAPHSAEIVYVFDSWKYSSSGDPRVNSTDRAVAKRVHSCWVAYAKANVKAKSLTCADGFTWKAYSEEGDDAAQFGETPSL